MFTLALELRAVCIFSRGVSIISRPSVRPNYYMIHRTSICAISITHPFSWRWRATQAGLSLSWCPAIGLKRGVIFSAQRQRFDVSNTLSIPPLPLPSAPTIRFRPYELGRAFYARRRRPPSCPGLVRSHRHCRRSPRNVGSDARAMVL